MAFFSGNLRWLWLILANSLRIVGGLLREPDLLDRAIDIWDLGGVVRAIDSVVFLQGYADPFLRLVLCVCKKWAELFNFLTPLKPNQPQSPSYRHDNSSRTRPNRPCTQETVVATLKASADSSDRASLRSGDEG